MSDPGQPTSTTTWTPPEFNASQTPKLTATGKPCPAHHNFVRTIRWCPDGSVALAHCEDGSLSFLKTVSETISVSHTLPQPAPVVDVQWYPTARSDDPALFCLFASVRECPVKLLDANDGRLRASYRIVDHRERQIAPHCMAFDAYATKLYCGFEDAIEMFDIQTPGEGVRLHTTPSKKSKEGLKGIISSISFCTDYSGLFAASSLSGRVALFSEETGGTPQLYLEGCSSAITQLKFNPSNPNILLASERRSDRLLCWDVRASSELLRTFRRPGRGTNQKMSFDVEPGGRWVVSGDETGNMHVYDLYSETQDEDAGLSFVAHGDTVGSVAIHPFKALAMSASGSRHFPSLEDSESDSDEAESDDDPGEEGDEGGVFPAAASRPRSGVCVARPARPRPVDATVKLWDFSTVPSEVEMDVVSQTLS